MQSAAENALSLQLFLITVFLPLMFLAALIRERSDKEVALRESEARYRALVMAGANIVWRANAQGEGFLATPGWIELTGQSEDEVKGLGWLQVLHPKDRERSERLWRQSMAQKCMYENEFQVLTRDGNYRYFHVQAVPILSSDKEILEWIGAAVDITERKDAALAVQRHRDELAHVTRITTMGELAASLAHELNQPLTAIRSNAQAAQRLLAADPTDAGELREILHDIVEDDRRAAEDNRPGARFGQKRQPRSCRAGSRGDRSRRRAAAAQRCHPAQCPYRARNGCRRADYPRRSNSITASHVESSAQCISSHEGFARERAASHAREPVR